MKYASILAVFVALQILDGLLTAAGIDQFGTTAEANPLLALGFTIVGPVAALLVAKAVAIGGAVMLYRCRKYTLLTGLTAAYLLIAIMPWVWALGTV